MPFLSQDLNLNTEAQADMQAPGFYWCTIQACAGIISACLPTLRPLVRGKSVESFLASLRSKFSHSWPASKLSHGSKFSREKSTSDASSVDRVHVGKPMGVGHQYDTSVEATQMTTLDEPNMDGIHVKSSVSQDLSFV